jgi:cysteine desulfurase
MNLTYLDYAAATPLEPAVLGAMQPYFINQFYNPSATYLPAVQVHKDVESARAAVAHWLGARPAEIIFTAGGTEANNLAVRGVLEQFPGASVVTSGIEHESLLKTAQQYTCKIASVSKEGIVDVTQLAKLIDDQTVLVSIMYANNEVGSIQPLRRVAQVVDEVRKNRQTRGLTLPLYFHTDAAQAAGYLDLHVARLGVDLLTLNAGKIYGPKQCGALFVRHTVQLKPQIIGGGQERGYRSGTENVAGIVGLAAALELVQSQRHEESARLKQLQQLFFTSIEEALPKAIINGSRTSRLPNNIHLAIPHSDNERLLFELEQRGILCAAGSACSASKEEPSHVLKAMGLSVAEARASLRFTMGRGTTEAAIEHTLNILRTLLKT